MCKISVIIPTFNKAPMIVETVKYLEKQTLKDFEVVVVDDGSTDDTVQQLAKLAQDSELDIRVFQTGIVDRFAMCEAINLGLRNARGSISLLVNDDIFLHQNCLEEHVSAHDQIRSQHAFIGPRFTCPPFYIGNQVTDPDVHKKFRRKHQDRNKGSIKGFPVYRKRLMVSSNLSVSTDKLCRIGGYNEYFKCYTGAIDQEMYWRLNRNKIKTLFLFDAQAYSVTYEYPTLQQTKWMQDSAFRDGDGVVTWKNKQMRYSRRREAKAKKLPPKPITRMY